MDSPAVETAVSAVGYCRCHLETAVAFNSIKALLIADLASDKGGTQPVTCFYGAVLPHYVVLLLLESIYYSLREETRC